MTDHAKRIRDGLAGRSDHDGDWTLLDAANALDTLARERDEARRENAAIRLALVDMTTALGIVESTDTVEERAAMMNPVLVIETSTESLARAWRTVRKQRAVLDAVLAALGNGADEDAWPPGQTVAEAVAGLRAEAVRLLSVLVATQKDHAVALREREALAAEVLRLTEGRNKAVHDAGAAIYFRDRSDYLGALWQVVKALSPELYSALESDTAGPLLFGSAEEER